MDKESSKKTRAFAIFFANRNLSRKEIIDRFISEIDLTPAGANTYYANFKRESCPKSSEECVVEVKPKDKKTNKKKDLSPKFVSPSKEDVENLKTLLLQIQEIGYKLGIHNILDKSKYREVQIAGLLEHELFVHASGGKNNNATYGADGKDKAGQKSEYKTKTIKEDKSEEELRKIRKGEEVVFQGVYNGAYTQENIDKYRDTNHYFALYDGVIPIAIIGVPSEEVVRQLTHNLQTSEKETTNCNSVFIKSPIDKADVRWKNGDYFDSQDK